MSKLKIIALIKKIYLIELEQCNSKEIPTELSQKDLPLSYKYYDPIIIYIKEKLSIDRKNYFKLRKCMSHIFN